jgi:hypothetical protein
MDPRRIRLLSELAQDASLERSDFVVRAAEQLRRFLEANAERIDELGGMVLLDDDPDYLSLAPDLTFRSRTRYQDESGEWVNETEVIESVGELVELYNPADILAAFIEAGQEAEEADEGEETDDDEPGEARAEGATDPYAAAADDWAAHQDPLSAAGDGSPAARLYDMALDYQTRSQHTEARLLSQFETAAATLANELGEFLVVDDEEQRLVLTGIGAFRAEVLAEQEDGSETWRALASPEALVEYYDPTDIFGDLADALAEAFPAVTGEAAAESDDDDDDADDDEADDADEADADGDAADDADDADEDDADGDAR